MVELNVRANQGITQAIATKLNLTSTDLKKLDASIWSGVMKDVQSSKSTNFTSKTNDVNSINDKNKNHSNFVIDKGAVKIDDGVWSKITNMIKNALNKSKPAATTATQENVQNADGSFSMNNIENTAKFFSKNMNTNNDNKIDKNEFIGAFTDGTDNTPEAKSKTLKTSKAFEFADLNNDGNLTDNEMKAFLENANTNGDKKLTNDEIADYVDRASDFSNAETSVIKNAVSKGYKLVYKDSEYKLQDSSGKAYSLNDPVVNPEGNVGREDDATAVSNEEKRKNEDLNHNGKISE